jgi:CBS domain-containing protein
MQSQPMQGFDAANPPFDRLTHEEIEQLTAVLDIGYFSPDEVIVRQGHPSDLLHVIIKGAIEVRDGNSLQAVLGPKDSFDSRAVVHGAAGEDFVAVEETLCSLIPGELVLNLIRQNPAFGAFFYADVSRKLDAFAEQRKTDGVESVLRARVRDARHRGAIYVDGAVTIREAGHHMRDHDINSLFVRDGQRVGVVTGMNLSKAVVLRGLPLETPVREVCHFDIVSVEADDFIFEALLLMTKHDKRRLAIRTNGRYAGFLEDIDILGLFAGNSQLIPGRIDRARSIDDLAEAARDIQAQVERLHRQGVKIGIIAEITSDLNRRLLRKLFEMLAPPSIRHNGCLLLMGSEGRGEQTVRTDQDNALLLADEVPPGDLTRFREDFSGALEQFGFPPCPGNVMVCNPVWSQTVESFKRQLRTWVFSRDPEAAMNLAIFCDAAAVAGTPDLVLRAKQALVSLMQGETALLSHFAHLIETFTTPNLGVLSTIMASVGVGPDEIDLKRAGIFPIVHGVRTMAVDKGILQNATAGRIAALVEVGSLESKFGQELTSALQVFMEFRLRSQLRALHKQTISAESVVRLDEITTVDRDILRDAFRVVRQFRELIRNRYYLGAF